MLEKNPGIWNIFLLLSEPDLWEPRSLPVDAAGMVTGGFSGIAILVKAWTKGLYGNGIPLWITNLILNVPLFSSRY